MNLTLTRRGHCLLTLTLILLSVATLLAAFNYGQDRRCDWLRNHHGSPLQISTFCP